VTESTEDFFFLDASTLRKNGNIRKIWGAANFSNILLSGAQSSRWLVEFDCKREQYRHLEHSLHSEPMAGGTVMSTMDLPLDGSKWKHVAPRSVTSELMKFACAK
jgi:hypothetical protein